MGVLLAASAAMSALAALCLLACARVPLEILPSAHRAALAVAALGFSGVMVSMLSDVPDALRRTLLVLFATVLLCSGFVALVASFAVSGASSPWL